MADLIVKDMDREREITVKSNRVVTTPTDLRDGNWLSRATSAAGIGMQIDNQVAVLSAEGLPRATVDLRTGLVRASSEWTALLRTLRQHYAEARFRDMAAKEGVEVRRRVVQPDGSIVLTCRMRQAE